jgi:hypothetical protein
VNANATPTCPFHEQPAAAGVSGIEASWQVIDGLSPHEALLFPLHKRSVVQHATLPNGDTELRLFHGAHELSFDDPRFFGFGQALARHGQFKAHEAMAWGEGHAWDEVAPLLAQLLDEGLLVRVSQADQLTPDVPTGPRPSPLPQARTAQAHSWLDCEGITQQLTGHALELGHLELVVPIFRIAHMALDADGRQVGEANVFPMPMRLDVPTDWRTCVYEGSRYLDAKPMNVTALKAMRAHWSPIMATLWRIRQAYVRRYPQAAQHMTLGDVECLSTLVLAVPTYQLMRLQNRVAQGALHPVLSSMFRVTDGLRMATHQMLFVPVGEDTLSPDTVVTGRDIHEYAERNESFHANHGVCAGPKAMIDEFLALLVDGVLPEHAKAPVLPDAVQAALDELDLAMSYGLLGLQAHAVVFSLWPVMTRAWAQMGKCMAQWPAPHTPAVQQLQTHLAEQMQLLSHQSLHATEAWRSNREAVYAAIHAHVNQGLGKVHAAPLRDLRDRQPPAAERTALTQRLRSLIHAQLDGSSTVLSSPAAALTDILMTCLVQTQAILGAANDIQREINDLLQRPAPQRAFTARDIDIHVLMQGREARRLPHLMDGLVAMLNLRVQVTASHIDIDESPRRAPDHVTPICPHGAGR